jgi:hypothetical protein
MYPWPASAISRAEMALLHRAREASKPRIPITELVRLAIVGAYGRQAEGAVTQRADAVTEPVRKAA